MALSCLFRVRRCLFLKIIWFNFWGSPGLWWCMTRIMFQDITALFLDTKAFKNTIDMFVERYKNKNILVVAGWLFIFQPSAFHPNFLSLGFKSWYYRWTYKCFFTKFCFLLWIPCLEQHPDTKGIVLKQILSECAISGNVNWFYW